MLTTLGLIGSTAPATMRVYQSFQTPSLLPAIESASLPIDYSFSPFLLQASRARTPRSRRDESDREAGPGTVDSIYRIFPDGLGWL